MKFEWDPQKAALNEKSHGISFEEAKQLFLSGAPVLEIYDVEHSYAEDRYKSIGPINRGVVVVIWTERVDDTIRIVSAWFASKAEEESYWDYLEGRL